MRKIVVSLSKGGVGKSSSAVTIAHGLALEGKRVLLVDLDDQGQDGFLLGVKPPHGLAEVLNDEMPVTDAIFKARENLWLLAGGKSLSGAKRAIGKKDFGAEQTLAEVLKPIESQFDFVILDTSPSWDALTINAMFYADEVLTPVNFEVLSLNSMAEFCKSIDAVRRYNPRLCHKYVLPTFCDKRVKKTDEILDQLKKHFPSQICDPVRYCVKISEAVGYGKTIHEFAPSSTGAKDYQKITQRILKDE